MDPVEILKKPYARQVVPQPDGVFKAEIFEFPGCFAVGDTAAEALANLEQTAIAWIDAAVAQGQNIPEPTDRAGYSGKLVLRMAKTLHKKAAQFALRDGVSLNQFIVSCVAEHVGMLARPTIYSQPLNTCSLQITTGGSAITFSSGFCGAGDAEAFQFSTTSDGPRIIGFPMRDKAHA